PPHTNTLSLHDALPILIRCRKHHHASSRQAQKGPQALHFLRRRPRRRGQNIVSILEEERVGGLHAPLLRAGKGVAAHEDGVVREDRKSTRLNSSHVSIS